MSDDRVLACRGCSPLHFCRCISVYYARSDNPARSADTPGSEQGGASGRRLLGQRGLHGLIWSRRHSFDGSQRPPTTGCPLGRISGDGAAATPPARAASRRRSTRASGSRKQYFQTVRIGDAEGVPPPPARVRSRNDNRRGVFGELLIQVSGSLRHRQFHLTHERNMEPVTQPNTPLHQTPTQCCPGRLPPACARRKGQNSAEQVQLSACRAPKAQAGLTTRPFRPASRGRGRLTTTTSNVVRIRSDGPVGPEYVEGLTKGTLRKGASLICQLALSIMPLSLTGSNAGYRDIGENTRLRRGEDFGWFAVVPFDQRCEQQYGQCRYMSLE